MLAVPAKIAGCREIVMCSPPDENGKINDVILYTRETLRSYKSFQDRWCASNRGDGFGTETVPNVYKIFGPGNQFVTEAKQTDRQIRRRR